jgi:hypothetical protein
MQIEVGPARRPGISSVIYDQPPKKGDFQIDRGGDVIDASGMKDERSRYRYRISATADEAIKLAEAIAL